MGLLERLEKGVVLGAEGYLFELERRGYLKSGPYVPEVVLDYPDAVRELHREFLRAGAEVMVAFTYYGHREKMRLIGREEDLEPLNRDALRLAREIASEGDALVAGNICNTWVYDPTDEERTSAVVRGMYEEQVGWAVEEGADLIISETNDYLGEALIGTEVAKEAGLPVVVTFASTMPQTIDGVEFDEACRRLEAAGADVVGLNCSRGPATMLPVLERIRAAVDCHVAAQPVPYRTTPEEFAFVHLSDEHGRRAFPICARAVHLHALRDGRLRARRARAQSRVHRDLLWRSATPRTLDGRGARARRAREPVLAGHLPSSDPRRPRRGEREARLRVARVRRARSRGIRRATGGARMATLRGFQDVWATSGPRAASLSDLLEDQHFRPVRASARSSIS